MVTIRLTRRGGKNTPFYHVVVTDSRKRQGGTMLEQVGFFNPVARGRIRSSSSTWRASTYWTGKGATMSDRVRTLVSTARKQAAA